MYVADWAPTWYSIMTALVLRCNSGIEEDERGRERERDRQRGEGERKSERERGREREKVRERERVGSRGRERGRERERKEGGKGERKGLHARSPDVFEWFLLTNSVVPLGSHCSWFEHVFSGQAYLCGCMYMYMYSIHVHVYICA